MVGVPAVRETIHESVIAKVNSGSPINEIYFQRCMYMKNLKNDTSILAQLADSFSLSGYYLSPTAYCINGAATTALVTERNDSLARYVQFLRVHLSS